MTLTTIACIVAAALVLRVLYPCARSGAGDRTVFFTGLSLGMSAMLVLVACGKQPATPGVDPSSDPSSQSASDPESDASSDPSSDANTSQSPSAALPPVDMTGASDEERMAHMFDRYDEMRTFIDRSQFDRSALAKTLDSDTDKIIDFVTDQVYFEQYPGLLRGAKGTLMAHAGNALDQSVLLATLLKDAGRDVRIARGTLTTAQADALITQMAVKRTENPIGDVNAMLDVRRAMMEEGGADKKALKEFDKARKSPATGSIEDSPIYQAARDDADWLLAQLEAAGVKLAEGIDERIRDEARDYFWVEHRLARGEDWVAVHPCFHDPDKAPKDLKVTKLMTAQVPEDLQHRLRVRVVIEQKVGESLKEIEVMPPWERPSANLVGLPLVYTNVPSGMLGAQSEEDYKRAIVDSEFYIPVFNHELAPGGQLFNPQGFTLPPEEGASNYGAVFATMGKKLGGAVGAIGTLGTEERPEDYLALSAQWIEYTLVAPGGEETTHRRAVFDRIGPANRAAEEVVMKPVEEGAEDEVGVRLSLHRNFMIDVGGLSGAFAMDYQLAEAENLQRLILSVEEGESQAQEDAQLPMMMPILMNSIYEVATNGIRSYRPAPMLVSYTRNASPALFGYVAVDIVSNPRRSFEKKSNTVLFSIKPNIMQGVWETYTEGTPLGKESPLFNQTRAMKQDPTNTRIFHEAGDVNISNIDADTRFRMRTDIGQANIAVTGVGTNRTQSWWRINAVTGEVIGKLADGTGGAVSNTYISEALNEVRATVCQRECTETSEMFPIQQRAVKKASQLAKYASSDAGRRLWSMTFCTIMATLKFAFALVTGNPLALPGATGKAFITIACCALKFAPGSTVFKGASEVVLERIKQLSAVCGATKSAAF